MVPSHRAGTRAYLRSFGIFAVAIITAAPVSAQDLTLTGVWRDESASRQDETTPRKVKLKDVEDASVLFKDVSDFRDNFHGTYESLPYLHIEQQEDAGPAGPFYLYSDIGAIQAEIHSVDELPGHFIIIDRAEPHDHMGTIVFESDDCAGRPSCFTIEAGDVDLGIPLARDGLPILFVPVGRYDPSNDPTLPQTFGDMFSPLSANFSYTLKCWHLAKMNPTNYQDPGCSSNVFAMPDASSHGYRKVSLGDWHNAAIPFGWTYKSTLFQRGENRGHVQDNGQDVSSSMSLKIGVSASVNVMGVTASSHVDVGTHSKVENMYNSKLTYAKAEYLITEFALVLNRFYAELDPALVNRVMRLTTLDDDVLENEYDRFVADFGTHYANAITFGAKGERILRMDDEQVANMHEGGVNVSVGMSAGYMGSSASVDVDTATDNMQKITSNTSSEDRQWYCYSGGSCNDGVPSSGGSLPVQLDLRPISDLLAPPFFGGEDISSDERDLIYTTIRTGLSRAVARHAYVERDGMDVPTVVFATVSQLDRHNVVDRNKSSIAELQTRDKPCGTSEACSDGTVMLTAKDGSARTILNPTVSGDETMVIPGTLTAAQSGSYSVLAPFTWSGQCMASRTAGRTMTRARAPRTLTFQYKRRESFPAFVILPPMPARIRPRTLWA